MALLRLLGIMWNSSIAKGYSVDDTIPPLFFFSKFRIFIFSDYLYILKNLYFKQYGITIFKRKIR